MPTLAIAALGVDLRMGNGVPLAPLVIQNASNATPIVITTALAHGVTSVSYGTVADVLGNTAANGGFVVEVVNATQLKLRGSVGNGAYAGGGTLTLDSTYAHVAEVTNIEDLGATATLVDTTSHDSNIWGSSIPTFLRSGSMRLSLNHVPSDPTHDWETTGLGYVMLQRTQRPFLVILPDGASGAVRTAWHFVAYVTAFQEQTPVAGALVAQVSLETAGPLTLSRT